MLRIVITILALAFSHLATAEESETSPGQYTGLNKTAVWSISRWDRDGDNLLEWTDNLMRESGLSTEDASELVLLETGSLTLFSPEAIASEGGRTKMYKDWVTRDLNLLISKRRGKYAPGNKSSEEVTAVGSGGQEKTRTEDDGSPIASSSTEETARPTIDPFELIGNTGQTSGDNEIENEAYYRSRWNVTAQEARQGDDDAQFILGAAYDNGDNRFVGPRDRVKAYICFSLAEAAGSGFAENARKRVEAEMPANDVAKAQLEVQRWTGEIKRNSTQLSE